MYQIAPKRHFVGGVLILPHHNVFSMMLYEEWYSLYIFKRLLSSRMYIRRFVVSFIQNFQVNMNNLGTAYIFLFAIIVCLGKFYKEKRIHFCDNESECYGHNTGKPHSKTV